MRREKKHKNFHEVENSSPVREMGKNIITGWEQEEKEENRGEIGETKIIQTNPLTTTLREMYYVVLSTLCKSA